MAYVSQDPNTSDQNNTTNVLASGSTSQPSNSQSNTSTNAPVSTSGYISNGNPYGNYATPGQPSQSSPSVSASSRKTSGPASGMQTNVQDYVNKNQQSSQSLGQAVAGKIQNTTDMARQNLQNVQNKFGQGVNAGSLENSSTAITEAQKAFNEAANSHSATKTWNAREASMYSPTAVNDVYSDADKALIASNKARAMFGDGSSKDFDTQADAQNAIDSYNNANPGFYTYGDDAPLSTSNDRLSQILNAQYQGPKELNEIGGYADSFNKFQDAASLQKQAQGSGFKDELLSRTFSNPKTEYGLGNKLLDDLLLGQGTAAATLKNTADKLGNTSSGKVTDEFNAAIRDARAQANTRTAETDAIKEAARNALDTTASSKDKEINGRINNVIQDWEKYPQYFKDRFKEELETHDKSSKLHNDYQNIANKYGSFEDAVSQKQSIEKNYPGLESFDLNTFKSAMAELNNMNNSGINAGPEGQARKQQLQAIVAQQKPTFDSIVKNNGGNPDTVLQYLTTAPSGMMDRSRRAHEQAISNFTDLLTNVPQQLKAQKAQIDQDITGMQGLKEYKNYDPNAMNLGLSQLESEALGIKGGEGFYNLLKDQGIDNLLKTQAYDKNKLISNDEQNQLARLQSMAELAKDYSTGNSGIKYNNKFTERDLAGQQNATSALDIDNLKHLLQGTERTFRTDAEGSNITGSGYGTGSSGGLFGKKKAQAWRTYEQNFGDLLKNNGGYRNIYSDEGVNKDILRKAANAAQGDQVFDAGNTDPGVVGGSVDAVGDFGQMGDDALSGVLGNSLPARAATNYALLTNPVTFYPALANIFRSSLGGSKAAAQGQADAAASAQAIANLQQNITNKINTTGLKNQFTVGQNSAQDQELFKLLGLLDTTNL